MAYYNCTAIFKFFFPLISKQFEATGAKKVVHKGVLQRLPVVWFHLVFIAAGVGISAWQLATLDYHECGKVQSPILALARCCELHVVVI